MNIRNTYPSIEQLTEQFLPQYPIPDGGEQEKKQGTVSFGRILQEKQNAAENSTLRFSKHANERLESRNIDLSNNQLKRLEDGTHKARAKGIVESLVMIDNLAFIVNIKNNTVVTAVHDKEDKIFTNIDGAVIN